MGWDYRWPGFPGVLAFLFCLAIVSAIILKQGGYDWMGLPTDKMAMYFVLGFLLILVGSRYMTANHEFAFIKLLSGSMHVLIPIMLLVSAGGLLNLNYANISPHLYKTPIYASLIAVAASIVIIFLGKLILVGAYYLGGNVSQNSDTQRKIWEIEAVDKMATMDLLYYAHPYHPKNVRRKALSKIKSRRDWQEQLVLGLQSEKAPEVFSFLAYNEVKDKTLFPQAVRQGILMGAKILREDIRQCPDANSLKQGWYSEVVQNVLLTVAKFEGMGVDYRPAVQELGNALDEPTSFEKQELQAKGFLSEWLKNQ